MDNKAKIDAIFRRNLSQYQTTINQLIFISCVATGIWAIGLFLVSNRLGFLNIPYEQILKFAAITLADIGITAFVLWWLGKKPEPERYVDVFKYALLLCAAINYVSLIVLIPYHEMWVAVFYFIFLSTLFFDVKSVLFFSVFAFMGGAAAYFYQPDFRPDNDQELLIRGMNFTFAVFGAVIISVLSRRLFRQNAQKEYELSVSVRDLEQRRQVAEGLRDILAVLNSERKIEDVLEFIVKEAVRIVDTDACALYKLDPMSSTLTVETTSGLPEEYNETDLKGIIDRYRAEDAGSNQGILSGKTINSMLIAPLISKNEAFGGICFFFMDDECAKDERCIFTEEKIKLATAFADQAALAIENARLKKETQEVAIAEERGRLARDLHDAVTQTLFSASLIAEALPVIWEKNQDEGRRRLIEIKELSKGALAEMRALLLELRPATLVETNLDDLLKHLSEAATGRARIPVRFENKLTCELPVDVKIGFYRIAQEAVNNIAKHSGATEAFITLKNGAIKAAEENGCVEILMAIEDNGKGFDKDAVAGDHLGLDIMQERAQAIGADLGVMSKAGQGTKISVSWRDKELKK